MELRGRDHVPTALTLVNSLHSSLNRRLCRPWRRTLSHSCRNRNRVSCLSSP